MDGFLIHINPPNMVDMDEIFFLIKQNYLFNSHLQENWGWSQHSKSSSRLYCEDCDHSICYELSEPYHWASTI